MFKYSFQRIHGSHLCLIQICCPCLSIFINTCDKNPEWNKCLFFHTGVVHSIVFVHSFCIILCYRNLQYCHTSWNMYIGSRLQVPYKRTHNTTVDRDNKDVYYSRVYLHLKISEVRTCLQNNWPVCTNCSNLSKSRMIPRLLCKDFATICIFKSKFTLHRWPTNLFLSIISL